MIKARALNYALLGVIIAAGLSVSDVVIGSADADSARPIRWLFAPPAVRSIAGDERTSQLLRGAEPFVITPIRGTVTVPPSWKAIRLISTKSMDEIRNALDQRGAVSGVGGILYDPEHWQFTPAEEQRDPARFEKMGASLAHARGLLFVAAPAVDLISVLAPAERKNRYQAYLRLGLAADAARYADAIDIQAQGAERDTELYADFVRQAAAQARQANPTVVVLAGISTNPNGQHVTADDILRAIAATRDVVDGYWLNIPKPGANCPNCNDFRPDIAIDILQRLAAQQRDLLHDGAGAIAPH